MRIVMASVRDLSLRFLGPAEVCLDGQPVSFATRKTLALLAYLVAEGGQRPREKLTALLWPDSDTAHGRAALRNTLAYLRMALDEDAGQATHLRADRATIAFERAGARLDLDLLTHAVADTVTTPLTAQVLDAWQSAAESCRGPFLEGLTLEDAPDFEDWLAIQRERWHRQSGVLLDRLTRAQLERGATVAAVETADRWWAHDPLNEVALRRVMEAHLAAGTPAAAHRAFEEGRARLERELGVGPEPETLALAERARQTPVGPTPRLALSRSGRIAQLERAFVGRHDEHPRLVEEYYTARSHGPRAVVIEGEAGIGKTRLASEFLHWASAQAADVLQGRASTALPGSTGTTPDAGGRLPYEAIVEALRGRLDRVNAPDDLLSDVWLAELGRILPELYDRYPDLPRPPGDDSTARGRLFEAVVRLVQALAESATPPPTRTGRANGPTSRPMVLLIDDLQWADAASLDLLLYGVRRWRELAVPLLLLFTVRQDEAPVDWLSVLERELPVCRMPLGPLTVDDTLGWLGAGDALPDAARDAFGRWLFSETHGHPFFVSETLKMLAETGVLAERAGADGQARLDFAMALRRETELRGILPPRVREVVRARLARLSPPAVTMLAAAAVLGQRNTFEVLCQVAGLDELEGLNVLDELVARRLLGAEPARDGTVYAFGHDKVREAVYANAGDARARVFHRRALEALEAAGAPPAALMTHARAAGLTEPAFRYALAAGDAALAVFAIADAIGQYQAAFDVVERIAPDAAIVERLCLGLGRANELAGAFDDAERAYRHLLDVAREGGRAESECLALNRLATVAVQARMDVPAALGLLDAAREVAERDGGTSGLAETEWNLAQVSYYARALESAHQHGERALALAREIGQPELIARALNVTAYALADRGDLVLARTRIEEAYRLYARLGNRVLEVDCLSLFAALVTYGGDHQLGIAHGRRAVALAGEVGNESSDVFSRYHLAGALVEAGALDAAHTLLTEALDLVRGQTIPLLLTLCQIMLGGIKAYLGQLDEALAIHQRFAPSLFELDERLRGAASDDMPPAISPAELMGWMGVASMCVDYALLGRWDAAYPYARASADAAPVIPGYGRMYTLTYEIEALLRAGELPTAARSLALFEACAGDSPRYHAVTLQARALLARHAGDHERAAATLREAHDLAVRLALPIVRRDVEALLAGRW
jgi:DNA-binding SARP family transcriptional activator